MYSGGPNRPSNGRTNVNKPFKSPVISNTPRKERPKIFRLLDDIEDSDEEDRSEEDRPNEVINLISPEKVSKPAKLGSEVTASSTSESKPTSQASPKDGYEIEEVEEEEKEEKVSRGTDDPPSAEALKRHLEKYDPVKIEKESPKPSPQKSIGAIRERYSGLLKRNGLTLDPKFISLLDDRFDREEPNSDPGSDSDNSLSSASSKKRKRRSSDSDSAPKETEASKSPKQKKAKPGPKEYRCPMCNEEVSKQLYESYLPDLEKKYKIDLRRKFHKSHKLAKVHKKVSELDIPEIDWETLEERCKKHFPYLSDIMARKTKSHFRDLSEKFNKMKLKDKSRVEAMFDDGNWEKTFPGYYGPRGSEIMGDAISNNKLIMSALKELSAAKDITTIRGGAGSYIQSILIPELGTRLIMDDFGMADDEIDRGRELMENTIDIGLLLNHGEEDGNDVTGVDDGMEWWWKEQEALRQQEEETEPSQSQTPIYIEASVDE
ncbi:uncharacterized protein DFL_008689 [Arthrobotrys flagrans]|uniref:Restriction of telomere capping protein 4 n=1 Tax=Arthrobotrys flagrans TaxID=97331 RepID=A0A436ZPH3_ARTFL|nr:hypothetical protein DFL_008689 [Arthrobotrys flagrans]